MSEQIGGNEIPRSADAGNVDTLLDIGRGGIVSARGTSEGLVIRLDARVEKSSLLEALKDFVEPRKSFLGGNPVALEWVGDKPDAQFSDEVSSMLEQRFNIAIVSHKSGAVKSAGDKNSASASGDSAETKVVDVELKSDPVSSSEAMKTNVKSLFDGISDLVQEDSIEQDAAKSARSVISDPSAWDDANARIVYSTVRSGQRIESEHSLIIIGDVNPGSEVIAGGDIVVLGTLRGIAHAGAYDESGGGRVIFALNLQPTQLRIGTTISRGSSEGGRLPEVARVEGTNIVVEQFQARSAWFRRWA